MDIDHVVETAKALEGVLDLAPTAGSEFPEIAWGDHFFYFAPDGQVPQHGQPFATIVTKDYPGDALSDLNPTDRWRLNIHVGRQAFIELTGEDPSDDGSWNFSQADTVLPHPVYRSQGWVSIINPGARTEALGVRLLYQAHDDARRRATRRTAAMPS